MVAILISWVVAACAELALAAGTADPPTGPQVVGEVGAFVLLGLLQAKFAPPDWRRGAAIPGLVLVLGAAVRASFAPGWLLVPAGLGVLVVAARVAHDLLGRLPVLPVGVVAGLVGAAMGRGVVLFTHPVALPEQVWRADLARVVTPGPAMVAGDGPPIVVITVDTLRADHMEGMASFARVAKRGASWPRAMSTGSWTVPSLASLWTGVAPGVHGAAGHDRSAFTPIGAAVPHLAEELEARGYATAAFVANPFIAPELGLARGFSTWSNPDQQYPQPLAVLGFRWGSRPLDGGRVVDRALDWLEDAPRRGFLLWVHLFDCHLPHGHLAAEDPAAVVRTPEDLRAGRVAWTPTLEAAFRASYAREVAYEDAQVERLLDALDARGFWEEGVLVYTADHGEELFDHGGFEHGHSHHGEVVDVGLAIAGPGLLRGRRLGVASLQDVAPTLRARVGLDPRGIDLWGELPAGRVATATGNLYGPNQRSARDESHRAILTMGEAGSTLSVYDLRADPGERSGKAVAGEALLRTLAEVKDAAAGEAAVVNTEALQALGYVEGPK